MSAEHPSRSPLPGRQGEPILPSELTIRPSIRGSLTVVELGGNLDLPGATQLMSVLTSLAGTGPRAVVCDLTQLAVPDLQRLLLVFPAAQRRSGAWPQSAIHLAAPTRELAARLKRLGMPRFLPVHERLEDAVAAAMADASGTHCDLTLPPEPSSAGTARAALARLWPSTRRERDLRQDGLVVVSELTTNAVRHVGEPFTVSMSLSPRRFAIGVTDGSRREPVLVGNRATQTGGRGMDLVASLSQDWGVRLVHDYSKTVWAVLNRRRSDAQLRALPTLPESD